MKDFLDFLSDRDMYERFLEKQVNDKRFMEYVNINYDKLIIELKEGYKFGLPTLCKIPKSDGGLREIYVYNSKDNWVLKLINKYWNEKYGHKISENVFSYREGVSVKDPLKIMYSNYREDGKYLKLDLKKYFNTPKWDLIKTLIRDLDIDLEVMEPLFQNKCIYEGEVVSKEMGLLPGSPISAFLSNTYLEEFDKKYSEKGFYIRYSDDIILDITGMNENEILEEISKDLEKYNLTINYDKVKVFQNEKVSYLGFLLDKTGIDIGDNKFKQVKHDIKLISKRVYKKYQNISKEERIKIFYKEIYDHFFKYFITDTSLSGIIGFWLTNITKIERLQQLDFYIISRTHYVITGRNNKSAMKQGWTMQKLENYGFISFIRIYKTWKISPVAVAVEFKQYSKALFNNRVIDRPKIDKAQLEIDFVEFITSRTLSGDILDNNRLDVDFYRNKICINNQDIDNPTLINLYNTTVPVKFKFSKNPMYDIDSETFIQMYIMYSRKLNLKLKPNRKIVTLSNKEISCKDIDLNYNKNFYKIFELLVFAISKQLIEVVTYRSEKNDYYVVSDKGIKFIWREDFKEGLLNRINKEGVIN